MTDKPTLAERKKLNRMLELAIDEIQKHRCPPANETKICENPPQDMCRECWRAWLEKKAKEATE